MQTLLETNRLRLRRFTPADGAHLFALDNDPEVMRYINGGTPTPRDVIETKILPRFLDYDDQRPGLGFWAAEEKDSGAFIGWFSLRPAPDTAGEASLGYRLRKAAWGQGYATEGAQALINLAFSELGIQRITATTYQDNHASRRVMEKLGMTLARTFRLTPQDLIHGDTSHTTSFEIWDGNDVEYAIEKPNRQ